VDTETFSPKEVAEIIGVSESTVKRWVDAGFIQVHRTKGGHRRIALTEIVQFSRREGMPILRPDLLGPGAHEGERGLSSEFFFEILAAGDGPAVRRSLTAAYSDGRSVAALVDDVIAPAFERLGKLWNHGEEGIFVEHRALALCIEALHQVRLLIPDRNGRTPVIVGGAPSGDPYVMPSLAASIALRDAGLLTVHLGADSPVSAFRNAVDHHRPRLIWVSMTSHQRVGELQRFVDALALEVALPIVIGGQAAAALPLDQPANVALRSTMRELVDYAREIAAD
jgi:MerR family transcriptional regulator, light-induced transcriptional regulator